MADSARDGKNKIAFNLDPNELAHGETDRTGSPIQVIKSKKRRLEKLISYCKDRSYENTAVYLQIAEPDMFTAISNRLNGKTTSGVERVMRMVNLRTNMGGVLTGILAHLPQPGVNS